MRDSIILPTNLESLFVYEAEKAGLVEPINNPADELFDKNDLITADGFFKSLLENKKAEKQNLFRTLLLFDHIILPSVTHNYKYEKLTKTGMFSIFYLEDELDSDPIHQDGHIEYAIHLKPAILPVFEKDIQSYFRYGQAVDGFTSFVSDLYDRILLGKPLPSKHLEYIKTNKYFFDKRNANNVKRLELELGKLPDILTSKRFFTDVSGLLSVLYESLCWQLSISSSQDAAIIDCDFQLANIGCDEYTKDVTNNMEAYTILKVECGKLIGSLPNINSLQEVINIKNQRRNDIHNLKQELSRLEYEIRKGNSLKAIEKAAKDIEKASKVLSKGTAISNIAKWTNVFSIPIGIASLFIEEPKIKFGAGLLTVVGQTSKFVETTIKDKNKWFEIIF